MNTDTNKGASEAPPSGWGPRIHRACKNHVKSPRRILVVDDSKVILKTTAAKLQAAGYEVLTAEDGGSAIRQVRQLQPHLILLDLSYPPDVGHGGGVPWDGLLILSWLRRTVEAQKIPVIVITGGNLEKYKDRFVEAGVLDIFLKPIDHEALLAAIRWALDEEVPEHDPNTISPSVQPPPEPSPVTNPAAPRKILFVDDTDDWRYLGSAYLGERGYEVATAENPIDAIVQASQFNPSLVVLDLNLGGQSAVTLLKVLAEAHPELPVLIYTAMDLADGEVSVLLECGAWNWLRKGGMEELVAAIEKTMSGPKGTAIQLPAVSAEAECGDALRPLDNLRSGTIEELLSAVEEARNAPPETTQTVTEPLEVVPDEVIASAAESILIVEEDAAFADTLRTFLESHSFRVSTVTAGEEAINLIAAADIDLIVLDLTLPGFPVQRFYDAVKAVKPDLCPRIIFMTNDNAHPKDDSFVRRVKGISLWKPFPLEWLLEAAQTIRTRIDQATANSG